MKAVTKPIFSIISIICLVASFFMAKIIAEVYAPKEDYFGYGALGVAIITLLSVLSIDAISGITSLVRAEQPKFLSISAFSLNLVPLIWLITRMPF